MSRPEGHFVRCSFKGGLVWVRADEAGRIQADSGIVTMVYKPGARRQYTTLVDRVMVLEPVETVRAELPDPPETVVSATGVGGGTTVPGTPAKKRPVAIDDPVAIHLWADGACTGNPGPCGAGTVIIVGESRRELSTWVGMGTNNVGELTAVLQGLQAISRPVERPLVIHTDSKYAIGVLSQGWKAKANQELVAAAKASLVGLPQVEWHWVPGHSGIAMNERCDSLAREAITRRRSRIEGGGPGIVDG